MNVLAALGSRWLAILALCLLIAGCGERVSAPNMDVILADKPAQTLAAYGLFTDGRARVPASGVVAYDLINPLFSDHADKARLVFLPEGSAASWRDEDVFAFPVGTVLIKSFSFEGAGRIETRLLIRKSAGWKAYPYVWNAARTEATYRPVGAKFEIEIALPDGSPAQILYAVPNQNQCKTCHQASDAILPIGPKGRNLGTDQVAHWQEAGRLTGAPTAFENVPSIALDEGDIAARARAYLDINCAHCHKSDGAASNSGLWLSFEEDSLVKLGVDKHPTAAGRGSGSLTRVIEPGEPDRSILVFRMETSDPGIVMPELGRSLQDLDGVELVKAWIAEMDKD